MDGKRKLAEEMQKKNYDEQIERNKLHLAEKHHFRNLERCMHNQRRERETAERLLKAKEREAFSEKQLERTEALARELDKIKRSELRELKLRLGSELLFHFHTPFLIVFYPYLILNIVCLNKFMKNNVNRYRFWAEN